jgi:RecA/RadA recombinase
MAKATKVTKKTEASDKDAFDLEIASFLSKNVEGIQVEALDGREQAPYWLTSTYALNWVVSGSFKDKGTMPGTKASIISGESGKGKSFLADILLGEQIRRGGIGIKLEVEDAGGMEFTSKIIGDEAIAKKIMIIGPTLDKKGEIKPITIEKLTSILNKLINKQLSTPEENRKEITFVIDSVSQLTSEKEYEDIQKDDDKRDMTPQQKLRALFRNLTQQFRLAKLTVIGIAHKTANIGVMFGPKMVTNAKGSGFGYASSLSLEIVSNKDIEDEKTKIPIAIKMRVRTEKNRFQYKGRQCWLKFNFGRGVEKYFGLSEILVQHTIATSSAKASVMGELGETSTIKWINSEDQKEYSWKVKEEEKFIKSWPKGEDDLFAIWEKQIEEKILEVTGGLVEVEEAEIEEDIDYEDLNLLEESAVA